MGQQAIGAIGFIAMAARMAMLMAELGQWKMSRNPVRSWRRSQGSVPTNTGGGLYG